MRSNLVLRALAAAVVALLVTAPARADVHVAPSPDGHLGAWLLASPSPGSRVESPVTPRLGGFVTSAREGSPYRVVAHADGFLDLHGATRTRPRGGQRAALSTVLRLDAGTAAWLLVGTTAPYEAYVAGRRIFTRSYGTHSVDWDVLPIDLSAGDQAITFVTENRADRWLFGCRVLARENLSPPAGLTISLEGATGADRKRLLEQLLVTEVRLGHDGNTAHAVASVTFPHGGPRDDALPVTVEIGGEPLRVGEVPRTAHGVFPLRARIPLTENVPATVTVTVGGVQRKHAVREGKKSLEAASSALRLRRKVDINPAAFRDPKAVAETLEYLQDRVLSSSTTQRERDALSEWVRSLDAGVDPLATNRGVVTVARRSPLDGKLHPLAVHVPRTYEASAGRRYPLVTVLHGYKGSPDSVLRAFLDRSTTTPHPAVDGFVVAPEAFGDAFYRGPGEASVIEALDWALAAYPIDPRRVSITGVSMGGTGAAHIGFRYADRFAAVAPLAGYHSYFVRRDTQGKRLRDWERARMRHWSPASWAENARHQHVFVAHGTKDLPLQNSRVLTSRLAELGYDLAERWPDVGHSVWDVVYAGAALFGPLSARTIPSVPPSVTVATDSLRYGQRFWVRVRAIPPGEMARLDAEVVSPNRIRVTTRSVREFELERPVPHVARDSPLVVEVDGRAIALDAGAPLRFVLRDGGFEPGTSGGRAGRRTKDASTEGAIHDAFLDPLVFIYGTGDPASTRANREAAEYFAAAHTGSARYPVLADREATPAIVASHSLFLIGSAQTNATVRAFGDRLPLSVDAAGVTLHGRRFAGPEVGVLFVHPHPDAAARSVVVLAATDCRGLYRARSLPRLLPDFVVFDPGVGEAAGEQVLGSAKVLAAGFFEDDWSLPEKLEE